MKYLFLAHISANGGGGCQPPVFYIYFYNKTVQCAYNELKGKKIFFDVGWGGGDITQRTCSLKYVFVDVFPYSFVKKLQQCTHLDNTVAKEFFSLIFIDYNSSVLILKEKGGNVFGLFPNSIFFSIINRKKEKKINFFPYFFLRGTYLVWIYLTKQIFGGSFWH